MTIAINNLWKEVEVFFVLVLDEPDLQDAADRALAAGVGSLEDGEGKPLVFGILTIAEGKGMT